MTPFRSAAFLLCLLAAACASAGTGSSAPRTDIAAARGMAPGARVSVDGVVTVQSGTFDEGFALQDATSGIYVFTSLGPGFLRGQGLRVTGTLALKDGLLGITPTDLLSLGRLREPTPQRVRTGDVGATTEGLLVTASGAVAGEVVDDAPWGWKVTLDDGSGPLLVFLDAQSGVSPAGIRPGARLEATGFSGRYESHFEVLPRTQADLRILP